MMDVRWSYKTVNFELKKEGLLGNAFIDEWEIEEVLNELGEEGWELVSMLETRDGVIAVFKRMWREESQDVVRKRDEAGSLEAVASDMVEPEPNETVVEEVEPVEEQEPVIHKAIRESSYPVSHGDAAIPEPEETDPHEEEDEENGTGVGSIKIE